MNRRQTLKLIFVEGIGLLLVSAGCARATATSPSNSANQPNSVTTPLLTRVQAEYASAQKISFGKNGAAQIAIQGGINWNFLVNDQPIGLGAIVTPTLDVPAIEIPTDARLVVRPL